MENLQLINAVFTKMEIDIRVINEIVQPKDWVEIRSKNLYVIWLVKEGNIYLEYKNAKYTLKKGDAFIFYPGVIYNSYTDENGCAFIYMHFSATSGTNLSPLSMVNLMGFVSGDAILAERRLVEDCYREFSLNTPVSMFRIKAAVMLLLGKVAQLNALSGVLLINNTPALLNLEKLLIYIIQNLARPLTVSVLATQMHMSEKYFISYFKKSTGTTPIKYVSSIRLRRAYELLYHHKGSISEIAERVGYGDPYTFSKAFKAYHGVSPSEIFTKPNSFPVLP